GLGNAVASDRYGQLWGWPAAQLPPAEHISALYSASLSFEKCLNSETSATCWPANDAMSSGFHSQRQHHGDASAGSCTRRRHGSARQRLLDAAVESGALVSSRNADDPGLAVTS